VKKNAQKICGIFFLCFGSTACTPHQATAPAVAHGESAIVETAAQPADSKNHLESITGIPLPQNTQVLHWEEVSGSDKLVRAVLAMGRADFHQWTSGYNLAADDFSNERRYLLGPNTGWWDVNIPSSLPTAQIMFDNSTALNVAYTETSNDQFKVYWLFHGT
jgi:hypothetical protein